MWQIIKRWFLLLIGGRQKPVKSVPLPVFLAQLRHGAFKSQESWSEWFRIGVVAVWAQFMRADIAARRAAQTMKTARRNRGQWHRATRVPS